MIKLLIAFCRDKAPNPKLPNGKTKPRRLVLRRLKGFEKPARKLSIKVRSELSLGSSTGGSRLGAQ